MNAPPTPAQDHTVEWDLVARAQLGDRPAFGELYSRYADVVFRFLLFRAGDRELSEDLTSETFLRALRRIDSVSYQGRDVGAWFVTIARNLLLDHVKSSRYKLERLEFRVGDELGGHSIDRTPLDDALTAEVTEVVLRTLAQLTRDQRECLELRFLVGLSVAETAVVMGREGSAVKSLQHRGVKSMAAMSEIRELGEVR
jgi:RNA polymerase sigma-70 factor, ECF subfamily